MKILFDTSPLTSGHKNRGIGRYTQELLSYLSHQLDVQLVSKTDQDRPDVIHYPTFDLFRPSLPLLFNQPLVITIHDLIPLRFPSGYPVGIKGQLAFFWQKLAVRRARVILTDSHESRADICHYFGIVPAKVVVIPLGVSDQFTPLSKTKSQKYLTKYQVDTPYILYVGDINYNKNLPALIQSLINLPKNIKLVCVGHNFKSQNIPEWAIIQKTVADCQLNDRVIFLNNIDQSLVKTIRALYSQALCYVQPSLAEGFGLPVLEALACGTLVLCSKTPALKEVGGNVVYFAEPKATDIALGIKKILRLSPANKKEKRREGMVWAKGFSWQRTGAGTVMIYQKVIDGEFN